jgi:pimeloyl-ACP methyl ester carboxylesterase
MGLLAAVLLLSSTSSSDASSTLSFGGCASAPSFSCATLAVPLDRTGPLPGTVALSVERQLSAAQPSRDAVVALAGGPGQAVLPLGEAMAKILAPALGSRDLLLFDQRGTGASNPLGCSAFEELGATSLATLYERCALDIGPARGDFTTAETVEDIDALRKAAGYEKLVLYGTSYGTKVALEYAERHPQQVEALVLDSVVPAEGREPLQIASFQAIPSVLGELCASAACAGITGDPVGDVARLAARLRRRHLSGSVFDGAGHRHAVSVGEEDLYGLLSAGDLNPALRALLPAAVHSALANDPDPLLRLTLLAAGLIPNTPSVAAAAQAGSGVNEVLFATTTCEETPFPWQRAAPAATRLAEAQASANAKPTSDFYPFDRVTALATSPISSCWRWPDASPPPPPAAPLPAVPTLVLSGDQDVRTPTALARAVAASIPGAQLVTVPHTGHSVLGSDLSGCATRALSAFFGGAAVQQCAATPNTFSPTPITPTRLASVHPPAGLGGRPGRTLVAVLDALVDINRQVIGAAIQAGGELPAGSSFGGLRGGFARLTRSALVLRRYAFVPGVALTGTFPITHGQLQAATISVSGSQAAPGSVHIGSAFKRAVGTLGGRRFSLAIARVHLSRAGASAWPSLRQLGPLLAPGRERGTGPRLR